MEILEISVILLILINIVFLVSIFYLWKRINVFFQGKKNKNFEQLAKEIIENSNKVQKKSCDFDKRIKELEKLSKNNFIKLGLIRFNPFGGLGGNQSFVLAMLDLENSGFIISSFYTKEGNRVYAKSIISGKPEFSLSDEEEEALQIAIKKFD